MKNGKVFTAFQNFKSIVARATQSVALVVVFLVISIVAWFVSGNTVSSSLYIYLFLLTAAYFIGVFYIDDILSPINIISHYVNPDVKKEVLVIGGGILYVIYMASIFYCIVELFLAGKEL